MANPRKVHLALNVKDVARSIEFYRAMFGVETVKSKPGYAKFDIAEPPLNLTLNYDDNLQNQGALNHLGIEVASTDDVLAAKERFRQAELATLDQINVDCCHALQDKVWISDPDGYQWEIFTVKVGDTTPELNIAGTRPDSSRPARCCAA